ncbi:MAG: hypothetical protein C6W54_15065 [Bacillaceae bacterium]|nr:MAG: hypothetical protein C6W54_15065 [Bacillaceae bacterium]
MECDKNENLTNPNSLYYKVDKVVMKRGEEIYVYDQNGNKYIDCTRQFTDRHPRAESSPEFLFKFSSKNFLNRNILHC